MVAYTQSLPKLYSDWTLAIPLPEVDQPVGDMVVSARIKGCANCELTSTEPPDRRSSAPARTRSSRYHRSADKIGDTFVVHVRDPRKQATVATHTDGTDQYMLVRAPADLGGAPREYRPRTWVILDDVSASRERARAARAAGSRRLVPARARRGRQGRASSRSTSRRARSSPRPA